MGLNLPEVLAIIDGELGEVLRPQRLRQGKRRDVKKGAERTSL
jgi:hypothetical protein